MGVFHGIRRTFRTVARVSEAMNTLLVTAIILALPVIAAIGISVMMRTVRDDRASQAAGAGAGGPSGGFGVFDEVFHPQAYQAAVVWEAQSVMPAPAPLAGDRPFDPDVDNRIRITPRASDLPRS